MNIRQAIIEDTTLVGSIIPNHYVASFHGDRGPWYVVNSKTGEVHSKHFSLIDADNTAYRLDNGGN